MVKNPPADAGVTSSIPDLGRSAEEQNGNLLQYSCLENPTDKAWRIPWTKEPGGLQSMGLQRVGHD